MAGEVLLLSRGLRVGLLVLGPHRQHTRDATTKQGKLQCADTYLVFGSVKVLFSLWLRSYAAENLHRVFLHLGKTRGDVEQAAIKR